MEKEGDLEAARNEFIKNRFSNVDFFIKKIQLDEQRTNKRTKNH